MSSKRKDPRFAKLRATLRAAEGSGDVAGVEAVLGQLEALSLEVYGPPTEPIRGAQSVFDLPVARRMWEQDAREERRHG